MNDANDTGVPADAAFYPHVNAEATIAAPPLPTITRVAIEDEVLRALTRPHHAEESAMEHFDRMERALVCLFVCLTKPDARLLHQRLCIHARSDDLSRFFGAMALDRRTRLMRVLADDLRRAALAAALRRQRAETHQEGSCQEI